MKTLRIITALTFIGISSVIATDRMTSDVQIFINNHQAGKTNGCSGSLQPKGAMRCGHPGGVSEVTWQWLRRSRTGDIYSITRKFPLGLPSETVDTKEVEYRGTQMEIWKDNVQRILLRPIQPEAEQDGGGQPVTRPESN